MNESFGWNCNSCDVCPGSEVVRFTEAFSLFNMRSANAWASCCVFDDLVTLKVSASECLLVFSVVCCGGAGTTKDVTFVSKSLEFAEECTVIGKSGGAFDFESSDVDVDAVAVAGFVILLFMIFSSINALTLTLAVCSGGPELSFFSHFLFSAS